MIQGPQREFQQSETRIEARHAVPGTFQAVQVQARAGEGQRFKRKRPSLSESVRVCQSFKVSILFLSKCETSSRLLLTQIAQHKLLSLLPNYAKSWTVSDGSGPGDFLSAEIRSGRDSGDSPKREEVISEISAHQNGIEWGHMGPCDCLGLVQIF